MAQLSAWLILILRGDLSAIQTTAKLVQLLRHAAMPRPDPRPRRLSPRQRRGRTVMEYEPGGKAADDIRQLYDWTCRQVGLSNKPARKRTAA